MSILVQQECVGISWISKRFFIITVIRFLSQSTTTYDQQDPNLHDMNSEKRRSHYSIKTLRNNNFIRTLYIYNLFGPWRILMGYKKATESTLRVQFQQIHTRHCRLPVDKYKHKQRVWIGKTIQVDRTLVIHFLQG
jgi:hypothetical protein